MYVYTKSGGNLVIVSYGVTVNPVKNGHSKKQKFAFSRPDQLSLNAGQKYFRPSLSYYLSLRYLFCLFWSGRFTQVLLYFTYSLTVYVQN